MNFTFLVLDHCLSNKDMYRNTQFFFEVKVLTNNLSQKKSGIGNNFFRKVGFMILQMFIYLRSLKKKHRLIQLREKVL